MKGANKYCVLLRDLPGDT